jgi:hypothetical protein
MARRKSELEEVIEALAHASAELRELRAASSIAFRHLNDNRNGPHYDVVGQSIQAAVKKARRLLEEYYEEESVLNLSGARKKTTLLEKRGQIDRMLQELKEV